MNFLLYPALSGLLVGVGFAVIMVNRRLITINANLIAVNRQLMAQNRQLLDALDLVAGHNAKMVMWMNGLYPDQGAGAIDFWRAPTVGSKPS